MFIIQTNTDFCCLFKILFFLYRDLIQELSVSIQGKQKERTDILINAIGKALGQIQNHRIPFLVQTSCAVRLCSCEVQLGLLLFVQDTILFAQGFDKGAVGFHTRKTEREN